MFVPTLVGCLALAATLVGATGVARADTAPGQERLTLENLYDSKTHDGPTLPKPIWIEDGRAYLLEDEDDQGLKQWMRVECDNGVQRIWLSASQIFGNDEV